MLVQRMALFGGSLPTPALTGVSFTPSPNVPNDGGGDFYITYSITNAAGGEYINVTWSVTGTSPAGTTSGPFTSSYITISTPLYSGDVINATVNLYTSTGALVSTVILSPYYC